MSVESRLRAALELGRWVIFADANADEPWTKHLPAIFTVVLATAINAACQAAGWYDTFEWVDLDRLQAHSPVSESAGDVSVVLITDREYEDPSLFKNTSPLAQAGVLRIVRAVCGFKPAVVAVDLLTADWNPPSVAMTPPEWLSACRVVWAHDASEPATAELAGDKPPLHVVRLGKVLGTSEGPRHACSALPVLARDSDGVVRYYTRLYPVRRHEPPSGSVIYEPTLPWAIASRARDAQAAGVCVGAPQANTTDPLKPQKIRFTHDGRIDRLHARLVLEAFESDQSRLRRSIEHLMAGRTVIIGGAYRHGRDVHATPVGAMLGAEVIANAVQTEADPIGDVRPGASFVIDLAVGLGLLGVILWLRLRWLWQLVASSLGAAAAAFLLTWILFNYGGYFLGVFASLAGVIIGVLVDLSWDAGRSHWSEWKDEFHTKRTGIRARVEGVVVKEENL